jgi:hypothetical protein
MSRYKYCLNPTNITLIICERSVRGLFYAGYRAYLQYFDITFELSLGLLMANIVTKSKMKDRMRSNCYTKRTFPTTINRKITKTWSNRVGFRPPIRHLITEVEQNSNNLSKDRSTWPRFEQSTSGRQERSITAKQSAECREYTASYITASEFDRKRHLSVETE